VRYSLLGLLRRGCACDRRRWWNLDFEEMTGLVARVGPVFPSARTATRGFEPFKDACWKGFDVAPSFRVCA